MKIAILGIGYVGYPLACLFSRKGYSVVGYDVDSKRIEEVRARKKIFPEYEPDYGNFLATNNTDDLRGSDVYIITVPTPLKKISEMNSEIPDLSCVESACETIRRYLLKGNMVILESTTYPGTTREVVRPILERSGLKAGKDFYLCFSPERIDPGNKKWPIEKIPKIVGGINIESRDAVCALYKNVFEAVVPVSSAEVAESAKILENIFRNINIALINEMAVIFEKMGIDIWEVIEAASTKPYGFMPHYPGPGIGGHCIPLDPFYFSYRAKQFGMEARFIELAGKINRDMPYHVISLAEEALKKTGRDIKNARVSVLGVAYKKNISDTRESPAEAVIHGLLKKTPHVFVFDPHTEETFGGVAVGFEDALTGMDCIIPLVNHDYFRENDIEEKIVQFSPNCCIIDTRNFLDPKKLEKGVYYKCLGK